MATRTAKKSHKKNHLIAQMVWYCYLYKLQITKHPQVVDIYV